MKLSRKMPVYNYSSDATLLAKASTLIFYFISSPLLLVGISCLAGVFIPNDDIGVTDGIITFSGVLFFIFVLYLFLIFIYHISDKIALKELIKKIKSEDDDTIMPYLLEDKSRIVFICSINPIYKEKLNEYYKCIELLNQQGEI